MFSRNQWGLFVLVPLFAPSCWAQGTRDYSGWSRADSRPQVRADAQVARYQAQGSLTDGLPEFPVLPDTGNLNTSSGGGLPSVLPEDLPPVLPAENAPVSPPPISSRNSAANNATQSNPVNRRASVLPSRVPEQRMPNVVNNDLRPTTEPQREPRFDNVAYQQANNNTALSETGAAGMRSVPGAQPGARGAVDPRAVTTGLPYVTPPPRGRYPTSYYNPALFQNAAFQRQIAARQQSGQTEMRNQPVGQLASNVTASPNGALLPQYIQPGIYPTAYQQCVPATGNFAPTLPPPPTMPQTGAVPGTVVPPTYTPNLAPGTYAPNNAGYTPLFSMGQENYNVVLGRGLVGQPTVYVPGQPIRNFFRYLSP